MDTSIFPKPSRIRRLRDIDNLTRETKEIFDEFEDHRRERLRLARKARKLANKVRKQYPDMVLTEEPNGLSLHEQVEELARSMYLSNHSQDDDSVHRIDIRFNRLFTFLRRLTDVPWLK